MRRLQQATRLALASATLALAWPSSASAQPSAQTRALDHQGVARTYIVVNAGAPKQAPRPLMLVLHGRRQPGEAQYDGRRCALFDDRRRRAGGEAEYGRMIVCG